MGMNITPLTRPEVPLTTSNLIVNSDLSMKNYNLQANNVHVGGSVLQVVDCIYDDLSNKYTIDVFSNYYNGIYNEILLPFIPSTYYRGSIGVHPYISWGNITRCITMVKGYKSDNTTYTKYIDLGSTYRFDLLDDTIGVSINVTCYSTNDAGVKVDLMWRNEYSPLQQPQTP